MVVQIRWITQAWFEIKTGDRVIHIDPSDVTLKHQVGTTVISRGLEKADLILITHHHTDHLKKETVDDLSKKGTVILAPEPCRKVLGSAMRTVRPREVDQPVDGIQVEVVDAYNTPGGRSTTKLHRKGECVGYIITTKGRRIYHAGDTDLIPEMDSFGSIDIALLPIGGTYTMDLEEAVDSVERIKPKMAIPMHQLGVDANLFRSKVEAKGNATKVVLLKNAGSLRLV